MDRTDKERVEQLIMMIFSYGFEMKATGIQILNKDEDFIVRYLIKDEWQIGVWPKLHRFGIFWEILQRYLELPEKFSEGKHINVLRLTINNLESVRCIIEAQIQAKIKVVTITIVAVENRSQQKKRSAP